MFWGWGGEDDDMSERIRARGLVIVRYPTDIARYTMVKHKKEKASNLRQVYLSSGPER